MTLTLNGTTGIVALDNSKVKLGTGGDLEIYHDGSNSYVDDAGTGRLYLRGNDRVQIQKYTGEDMITAIADGAAKLYYDNANKLETIATGVNITGGIRLGGNNAVNELDDYEEGTFDVTLTTVSGSVTLNSVYNKMSYTKVGRLVTVFGLIITSGVSNPSGAYAHFDTLPFTSANLTEGSGRSGGGVFYWDGSNPHVKPWEISEASTRLSVYIDASTLTAGDDFYFSCTYQAA